eukprot:10612018-Ditylum_brightwellii.AAC.1
MVYLTPIVMKTLLRKLMLVMVMFQRVVPSVFLLGIEFEEKMLIELGIIVVLVVGRSKFKRVA